MGLQIPGRDDDSGDGGTNTIIVSVKNSDGTGEVSSTAPAYTVSPATVPSIVINSLAPSVASLAPSGTCGYLDGVSHGRERHITVPVLADGP